MLTWRMTPVTIVLQTVNSVLLARVVALVNRGSCLMEACVFHVLKEPSLMEAHVKLVQITARLAPQQLLASSAKAGTNCD